MRRAAGQGERQQGSDQSFHDVIPACPAKPNLPALAACRKGARLVIILQFYFATLPQCNIVTRFDRRATGIFVTNFQFPGMNLRESPFRSAAYPV